MTRKPQLLVSTSTFPRWEGDAVPARFVLDLSKALTGDFDVTVVAPHDPGAAEKEMIQRLDVRRFKYFWPSSQERLCNGVGIVPNMRSSLLGKLQIPCLQLSQVRFLRSMIKSEEFDAVHSHWLVPSGLSVARARSAGSFRHVVTLHSTDLHFIRRLPFGRKIAKYILRRTDSLFVVSSFLKGLLETLIEEPVDATVLPMGVYTRDFQPAENCNYERPESLRKKRVILYVGKLIEVKGVEHLLNAYRIVCANVRDTKLVIVGGGDLDAALKEQSQRLGLANDVQFVGPKPHSEVKKYYQWAEVVALPSIVTKRNETEGMPTVILESFASGTPVVASDVGSLRDVIKDDYNGALVEPQSPELLADGLLRLLSNSHMPQMSRNAVQTASQFDWSRIAEAYSKAFCGTK